MIRIDHLEFMKFMSFLAGLPLLFTTTITHAQPCGDAANLQNIKELIRKGEFQASIAEISSVLDCAPDSMTTSLLLKKYKALRNQREYSKALKVALSIKDFSSNNQVKSNDLAVIMALTESHIFKKDQKNGSLYFQQLLALAKTTILDVADQARLDYIKGLFFLKIENQDEEGIAAYHRALKLLDDQMEDGVYLQGLILRSFGNMAQSQGDFPKALRHYQQELDLYQKNYASDHVDVAVAHYNIGGILYETFEYKQALDHYLLCFDVWDKVFDHKSRYYRFLTEAIGDMYWELGNRPKALEFYNRSVEGEKTINLDSSQVMTLSGDTLLKDGEHAEALQFYKRALAWRERNFGNKHALTAACQNFIGKAYEAAGNPEEALEAYQQSVHMLVTGFSDPSPYVNPPKNAPSLSVQHTLEALAGKGAILLDKAETEGSVLDLKAASETLLLAIDYLEQFRRSPMSESSKLFWNRRSIPLLENAIRASLLLHKQTNDKQHLIAAFTLSEKSRAFLLLAALQEDKANQFADVPADLITQEQNLRRELLNYENKVLGEERRCTEAREKQLDLWREKLNFLHHDYNLMLDQLQREYPRYFELKYDMGIVEVADLQTILGHQEAAMVSFYEGVKQIYIFYLDAGQLKVFEIEKSKDYQLLTQRFSALVKDKDRFLRQPVKTFQSFVQTGHELYDLLLQQPLSICPGTIERLLIIPGQSLAALPFNCLLSQKPDTTLRDYRHLPYLFQRFAIAYAPSATVWHQAGKQYNPETNLFSYSGFAPDYAGVTYPDLEPPIPLLYANEEITKGAQLFKGRSFLGNKATEKAFKKQASALLHIAAHAWLDDAHPLQTKFLFTPEDTLEDGILYGYEIYGLHIPAQLAILSACHTAAGHFEQGEGIMSLERAFQYAGCPSLLSSFWAANDESSALLTGFFLENIKKGLAKDIALQKAQQRILEQGDPATVLPFYWAGFSPGRQYSTNKAI